MPFIKYVIQQGGGGGWQKNGIKGRVWSHKSDATHLNIFPALLPTTRFLQLCISQGSDNITVSNYKKTSKRLSVRLRYL